MGAYITHDPDGVDTKQLSAVPTDIYPFGHDASDIVMSGASIATYPTGHDVDGSAPIAMHGHNNKKMTTSVFMFCLFLSPLN